MNTLKERILEFLKHNKKTFLAFKQKKEKSKAFNLGVQTEGSSHLDPVSRDIEYERICENFMEVCWFF